MKARVRRSAVLVLVVLVVLGVAGVAAATARASAAVDEGAAEKDSLTCLLEQFAMCEEACTYAEGYGVTFKVPELFVFDEEYSVDEDCLCWRHDTLPAILGVFEMSFDESLGDAELLAELEAASHDLAVERFARSVDGELVTSAHGVRVYQGGLVYYNGTTVQLEARALLADGQAVEFIMLCPKESWAEGVECFAFVVDSIGLMPGFEAWLGDGVETEAMEAAVEAGAIDGAAEVEVVAVYADGSYTATGKGLGGDVPVTVFIRDGKVSKVVIGYNHETVGIGSRAIEQLPELIVEANGVDGVDVVSGATVTSRAILGAVGEALERAVVE